MKGSIIVRVELRTWRYINEKRFCRYARLCAGGVKGYEVKGVEIDPSTLIFEERIKMNCFYCGRYNVSWKCPPKVPNIDYEKMLSEFACAALIYIQMPFKNRDYNIIRQESSVQLHRALLECEKWLYEHNNPTALSFIGGSCKLCKNGCAPDRCANPYQSRTPVEALGINIIKSAAQYDITIAFPPTEYMTRIGLLLW